MLKNVPAASPTTAAERAAQYCVPSTLGGHIGLFEAHEAPPDNWPTIATWIAANEGRCNAC